ncbi:hypothetical protein GWK47_046927 [Chionoecetes opilio]|uniref:Uncharacterized protein n=1 Tax=Chionoecetes opilio TaxID=41210 RepID=A0A8J5CGN8_CHIOP|nr:hypothetical protein GWK47_046927 [Chionoecetes opilio]
MFPHDGPRPIPVETEPPPGMWLTCSIPFHHHPQTRSLPVSLRTTGQQLSRMPSCSTLPGGPCPHTVKVRRCPGHTSDVRQSPGIPAMIWRVGEAVRRRSVLSKTVMSRGTSVVLL